MATTRPEWCAQLQGRLHGVAFIENGTWAPQAAKVMKELLAPCKGLEFVEPVVTVRSSELDGGKAKAQVLAAAL